jgi:hypothetical protein
MESGVLKTEKQEGIAIIIESGKIKAGNREGEVSLKAGSGIGETETCSIIES